MSVPKTDSPMEGPATALIASALPMPVLLVGPQQQLAFVNPAAEQFFDTGAGLLLKQTLDDIIPFGSPLFFSSLLVLALSEVFRQGLALKDENALTI